MYRWAALVFATTMAVFAMGSCVLQDLLDSILGGIGGA